MTRLILIGEDEWAKAANSHSVSYPTGVIIEELACPF